MNIFLIIISFIIIIIILGFFIKNRYDKHMGHFIPQDIYRGIYQKSLIDEGFKYMKTQNIIFTGLARNIEKVFDHVKQKYEFLGSLFKDYKIVIVENDSNDKTRKLLLDWKKSNDKVVILGCGFNKNECIMKTKMFSSFEAGNERIDKMVMIRNIYIDFIKHLSSDYVAIVDFDIHGSIYADGIAHSFYYFSKNDSIDAIGANAINNFHNTYYDPFALVELNQKLGFNNYKEKMKHDFYIANNYDYKMGHPLIPVRSCFAGFAIYKLNSIRNRRYNNTPKEKLGCEHIYFNDGLNMFMNPSMLFSVWKN